MSAPKHTPGTWIITPDAPGSASLVVRTQSIPHDGGRVAWIPHGPRKDSDARLVASSPRMLAALVEIKESCERRLRKGNDSGDRETLRLCREAIAEATGESVNATEAEPQCCICGGPIAEVNEWRDGHNAQPVADGRCCGHCNKNHVVPARVREMMSRYTGGE